ncbi:MAG TPA: type I restriction-modification system subunit M N-terminal domain-containing protein [bacterium]|nr:type I restriction-modification system subunit M N-terminal domain-containing protein [bacterium]
MKEKDISFEDKLWKAADRLRKKVEVHEYKYVVLGLIFLRYLSFAFDEGRKNLQKEQEGIPEQFRMRISEDRDYYLADGILYVPEKARWDYIVENATQLNIGEILDEAVETLEKEYPKQLKDVIPKVYI